MTRNPLAGLLAWEGVVSVLILAVVVSALPAVLLIEAYRVAAFVLVIGPCGLVAGILARSALRVPLSILGGRP